MRWMGCFDNFESGPRCLDRIVAGVTDASRNKVFHSFHSIILLHLVHLLISAALVAAPHMIIQVHQMVHLLSRESRSHHNFAQTPTQIRSVNPIPTPKLNHPDRLVRKYRNKKVEPILLTQKKAKEDDTNTGGSKSKNVVDKKPSAEHKLHPVEEKDRNDRTSADVTNVPDPVPDVGIFTSYARGASTVSSIHVGSITMPPIGATSTLSSLSALLTTASTGVSMSASSTLITTPTPTHVANTGTQIPHLHHISVLAVTLLAVGAAFVLLGLFIVIKACSKPKRRQHIVPSLPIMADAFPPNERFAPDGSPIFGGKERVSPRPGSNGALWAWTQYPQPAFSIAKPTQAAYGANSQDGGKPKTTFSGSNEKAQYLFADHAHSQGVQTPANSPRQAPLQQVQTALTRAVSRLSTVSMSLYPGSPGATEVGLAVGNGHNAGTVYTADGHPAIKRVKSRASLQRSRSHQENAKERESTFTRYSQGFAYDGADVTSPPMSSSPSVPTIAIAPSTSSNGGRSRIKSTYYAPGSYPRTSASTAQIPAPPPAKTNITRSPSNPFQSQTLPPLPKSASRRDRDTHALTSALGLESPAIDRLPSSPQPTLYPDDSLSVIGENTQNTNKRSIKKPAPKYSGYGQLAASQSRFSLASPPLDSSAALGSLMLMDFGTSLGGQLDASISHGQLASASTATLFAAHTGSTSLSKFPVSNSKKNIYRSDDKPPRVPSPPALPSLAQMGLEHTNPDAYADYRSPTYSIYGLYESDRKSKASFGY